MLKSLSQLALLGWTALALGVVSCGDEDKPQPGYSHPCSTPMAGVLGCPAGQTVAPDPLTVNGACQKMVECGILAQEYMRASHNECGDTTDCAADQGSECRPTDDGNRCHDHFLDYRWCTHRLSHPTSDDPCDRNVSFTNQHLDQVLSCVGNTTCQALGASFEDKRKHRDDRSELDQYTCQDGTVTIWTASTCDFGLLLFDRRQ